MSKLSIAIFFGGNSSEYSVSLESAYSVITNLDQNQYQPILVGISRQGDWFYFTGDIARIKNDSWLNEEDCAPAALSPSQSKHQLLILKKDHVETIQIDAAFPILHGKNGEDGTLQGLIELAGIPLVGCGVLASALCMDKDRAHKLAEAAGAAVPKAKVIEPDTAAETILSFAQTTGYPLFVKPVKAGSSYGITRVKRPEELMDAVALAFQYDDQVILEETIDGFEVGCAVMGNSGSDHLITGEVDEIELSGGFFDFTEKYTLKTSAIHVPARISAEKSSEIRETAKTIYQALGCSIFARVDMFLTPEGKIYFNEINTIPGFTEHSRYPGMMKAAGLSFPEILSKIIELAVKK